MTSPLNAGDLSSIREVDKEINSFIEQIEKGNAPNPAKLLQIEKELKSLVKNKNIPDSVKQGLQSALKQLSADETSGGKGIVGLSDLYSAKMQVDQALEEGQQENK